jgi:hypothetical protein
VLGTAPGLVGEGFISADLGTSTDSAEERLQLHPGCGCGFFSGSERLQRHATITAYYATARPMSNGTTGTRSFAVNAGNTIWQVAGATAPTEPFGAPATPIQ